MHVVFAGLWSDLGMDLLVHGVPLFFAGVFLVMAVVSTRRTAWLVGASACRWLAVLTAVPVVVLGFPVSICASPVGAGTCSFQVNGLWLVHLGILGLVVLSSGLAHRRVRTRTALSG